MSLARAYKEHQNKQTNIIKPEREHLKSETKHAVSYAVDSLYDAVNLQVSKAFQIQRELEAESKRLEAAAVEFSKQTRLWLALVNQFNDGLKELGDVQNWSGIIEKDVRSIVGTMERVAGIAEEEALGSSSVELVETKALTPRSVS
ncbi:hypothetical protein SmJEL517_g00243 [Synchytrium microbalum]|uniref:Biogenesis of lysosome-related organelles complex 1 subunit 1 n=1 Tax=Synchytrium microbalum TaxID=1806994 RepID=A0A507C9B7_9FUNG|nr:uncharacterized protein SmJEL517_g00243 [Synchytrium microbalum]TPX38180.1 hypothetical protein SmJEL517_g00243 [Synchytrium microbalum]